MGFFMPSGKEKHPLHWQRKPESLVFYVTRPYEPVGLFISNATYSSQNPSCPMGRFIQYDRYQQYILPPSVDEWPTYL